MTVEKKQANIITYTVIASLLAGTIFDVLLPELSLFKIPTLGNIFVIIMAIGLFYAIFKYRLLSITPAIAAESIISAMDELLILLNQEGNILTVNKATSDSLQYDQKELEGKSITMLFTEDNSVKNLLEKITKEEIIKNQDSSFLTKNGNIVPVIYSSAPLKDEAGFIIGTVFLARDITEHKLAEKEILRLNAELEQRVLDRTAQLESVNRELEAFTYSVSHDLRAPLRHISGYVDLLISRFHDSLTEKGIHYLDSIADSSHQMGILIDDLLHFSKSGRKEIRHTDLDMNMVFQEALKMLKQDISGRKIEWIIGPLPHIYGDNNLMQLVWINLLSNAVKFTRKKKIAKIETGFRDENKEFLFFVRDNGAGFDMQYVDKLYGVFQRLHSSQDYEGTGIGLANVHRIITKHGGRTWAEAEIDKGATFYFTLPKEEVGSQQLVPSTARDQRSATEQ